MLERTYKEAGMNDAFREEAIFDLELPNENHLKAYVLPIINSQFDYKKLKEAVSNNIKNYVFSRKEIQDANSNGKADLLYNNALKRFRQIKNDKDKGNGAELGEILLYLFMEHDLNAPKLFSKMELKTNPNDYIKGADGVFLRKYINNDIICYDLVIGESKLKNDLTDAINEAFKSIKTHLSNSDFELDLVNENLFKETYSEEEAESIKRIIVPSHGNEDGINANKSFGIFIGYSLNAEVDNLTHKESNEKILEKIRQDAQEMTEEFKKRISKENLRNYSFYVYILPFNNAQKDREEIMKDIIG